jgi:hypothetical protein
MNLFHKFKEIFSLRKNAGGGVDKNAAELKAKQIIEGTRILDDGNSPSGKFCPICDHIMYIQHICRKDVIYEFHRCKICFYISKPLPDGYIETYQPRSYKSSKKKMAEIGQPPSREYSLAKQAIYIFSDEIAHWKILIFGAGHSLDYLSIMKMIKVDKIAITDIKNYQNSDYFINLDSNEKFNCVIASEVIEHFDNPVQQMENITKFITDDGIIILGTNLNIPNGRLDRLIYPYAAGHCSYWSAKALYIIAEKSGFHMSIQYTSIEKNKKRVIFLYKNPNFGKNLTIFSGHRFYFV